jgi:hypothetical protein
MSYSVQKSINFASTFIQYSPMAVGAGLEPAISYANEIQNTISNAPFTWGWNRAENVATSTVAGTQDYVCAITNFSFLEKISLQDPTGAVFEVGKIYNTATLGKADATALKRQRPEAACILAVAYGTNFTLRFMGVPDKVYIVTLTYQKLLTPLAALADNWGIPDQYIDIYNALFVAEAMALVDDGRAAQYRTRGITALISKAEGLTELQKSAFLDAYWQRNAQQSAVGLNTQLAAQARGI